MLALPNKSAVIVPALKFPTISLLTIVLLLLTSVAALAKMVAVLIVEELDPPTLLTVGEVAMPPKSPANCILPLTVGEASGVAALVVAFTNSVVAN